MMNSLKYGAFCLLGVLFVACGGKEQSVAPFTLRMAFLVQPPVDSGNALDAGLRKLTTSYLIKDGLRLPHVLAIRALPTAIISKALNVEVSSVEGWYPEEDLDNIAKYYDTDQRVLPADILGKNTDSLGQAGTFALLKQLSKGITLIVPVNKIDSTLFIDSIRNCVLNGLSKGEKLFTIAICPDTTSGSHYESLRRSDSQRVSDSIHDVAVSRLALAKPRVASSASLGYDKEYMFAVSNTRSSLKALQHLITAAAIAIKLGIEDYMLSDLKYEKRGSLNKLAHGYPAWDYIVIALYNKEPLSLDIASRYATVSPPNTRPHRPRYRRHSSYDPGANEERLRALFAEWERHQQSVQFADARFEKYIHSTSLRRRSHGTSKSRVPSQYQDSEGEDTRDHE